MFPPSLFWCSFVSLSLGCPFVLTAAPIISEFMAANKSALMDEDGAFSDWIEIHNPDPVPVDLTGWRLTDSASRPEKWIFPSVILQPGEFRIVFASSKNRINPAGQLHTNFALAAGGEYLALSSPLGIKSSEFAPTFPAQQDDVSFGLPFASSTLVAAGQSARYLVPASPTPAAATWTAPTFNDSAWASAPTGLGFGLSVPGMLVKEVQITGELRNLASLDAALAGVPNPPALVANTQVRQVINFLGDGGDGRFPNNLIFALPGEEHGLRATGFLDIPTAGPWTLGVNSDDGSRLRVDLNHDGDFADAGETPILDDSGHGAQDRFGTVSFPAAGSYRIEFVYFEGFGGDEVELFAQAGTHTVWNNGFRLIGDTANGGLAIATPPDGASSGGSVIATNLQAAMLTSPNFRPSCYVRSTFNLPDAAAVNALSLLNLGISYNDGFTAWLNGTLIASRNAPPSPAWNSTATASRNTMASLTPENINITAFRTALIIGNNKLAVHGHNISADDASFLVLPTLTGGSLQTGGPFYFQKSTPGTLNNTPSSLGFVADTTFSHRRGLYTAPFTLTVTTPTPGATLHYTLDGSKPSLTNGTVVSPPNVATPPTLTLPIGQTLVVRVMASKTNFDSTNIDTNTYLFLDDVITQPSLPPAPGWPDEPHATTPAPGKYFRNGQEYDYGMDPDIVNAADPAIGGATQVKAALQALPSICVTVPVASLTAAADGIYSNASNDGFAWEREASIEMLNDPNTADRGFQENCGLRIRGGFSRTGDNPKHAFRILFRSEYGQGKLDYPLFAGDDGAATTFDKFDIQTSQNYSWSFNGDSNNNFLRELWCRDTQLAMKQPSTRGRFVHLYLNGTYWGLFQIQERAEADFAASYLGGTDDDYDVAKVETGSYTVNPTAGDLNAWTDQWNKSRASYFINTDRSPVAPYDPASYTQTQKNEAYFRLMGRAADGVTPTADPVLLDVDNLIDYMLIVFYSGNTDAPLSAFLGNDSPNNFYAIRDRRGGKGFLHIQHDGEHTLNADATAFNRVGPFNDPVSGTWNDITKSNAQFTHQDLAPNAEYRMRFADRTYQRLISPNGVLNTVRNQSRLAARAAQVESAIIAESARWGDSKRGTDTPLDANTWRSAANATLGWFGNRSTQLLSQLQNAGLYPSVAAPAMSQSGGLTTTTAALTLSAPATTIYYTVNGVDPRQTGGTLSPAAQIFSGGTTSLVSLVTDGPSGTAWRYRDNGSDQGTAWRQPGFNDSTWSGPARGQFGYGEGDENTVVSFGPNASNKHITTYFRTTFTGGSLAGLSALTLEVKRDDGIIVYLNGTEIVRDGFPADAVVNYQTPAALAGDDGFSFIPFVNLPLHLLNATSNTLAVEVHQNGGGSSDLSFDCRLTATRTSGGTQIFLPAGVATVRARVRDGSGTWSALNEQEFLVNSQPATAANLTVSEIMYHPVAPSPEELAAGFLSADEFEWIELQNTGSVPVDLRGAYFFEGISYTFPQQSGGTTLLPAGGRVILCENIAAFRQRYGTGFDALIAGQYSGTLDNGGERLLLKQPDSTVILDFTYGDAAPWPAEADGAGRSLVLHSPGAGLSSPSAWRPSAIVGGSPAGSDTTTYAQWKTANAITSDAADPDKDGLNAFTEYVHGTDPALADPPAPLQGQLEVYPIGQPPAAGLFYTLSWQRNLAAGDVDYFMEQSSSLNPSAWSPLPATQVSETVLPATGGRAISQVTWRTTTAFEGLGNRFFLRLRTVQR